MIIEINCFNVFFDVESKYEIGSSLSFTVLAMEWGTIIISNPVYVSLTKLGLNFNTSDVYKKYSTGVELSTEYSAEDIMGILGLGLCVGSFVGCYIYCYLKCPVLYHMCSVCHEEELIWISYRTYIKQRNNKRRLTRTTQAPTHPSAPLPPPLPSPYSPPFTPLPSAPFPTRSGPIVEVDIEITNTPNLLTVTENHKNECHSPSATSLPPYDIAVMDQQLPTYEQAIACTQIQLKK